MEKLIKYPERNVYLVLVVCKVELFSVAHNMQTISAYNFYGFIIINLLRDLKIPGRKKAEAACTANLSLAALLKLIFVKCML